MEFELIKHDLFDLVIREKATDKIIKYGDKIKVFLPDNTEQPGYFVKYFKPEQATFMVLGLFDEDGMLHFIKEKDVVRYEKLKDETYDELINSASLLHKKGEQHG